MSKQGVLVIKGGNGDGKSLALLPQGVTMIGRGPLNDIPWEEPGISRQHVGIMADERGFWIADLGSRNGTFVNGERLGPQPRLLRNFDRLELGGTNTAVQWVFLEEEVTVKIDTSTFA
ncbi:MAG: FHA domain-containing protein [SAR202 cluster bacterium]|nr:FHA domain-containing protein [SAR202 cluster bacterium]